MCDGTEIRPVQSVILCIIRLELLLVVKRRLGLEQVQSEVALEVRTPLTPRQTQK